MNVTFSIGQLRESNDPKTLQDLYGHIQLFQQRARADAIHTHADSNPLYAEVLLIAADRLQDSLLDFYRRYRHACAASPEYVPDPHFEEYLAVFERVFPELACQAS